VKSIVLTPIAAHLASDRSLVLHPEAAIKLQILTGSQNGVFSADGQLNREVKDGAIITVHKSQYITKFLRRRPPTYFYQIINAKLKNDRTTESAHTM
jgi:NAD+ kinase